ncbi:MAG: hypothetical protein Q8Q73_17600 [Stagnimonas sp.]|nr:hypothetical protein [Stagnimonas sp.]
MSGPEHLPPDDHELEAFLAGRGPHRARYSAASQEQAPAALDAAVLAQAGAAVAAAPTVRVERKPPRWRLPLSLAATLVLGLGLVSRVQRESALPPAPRAPAAEAAAVAAADAPASAPSAEMPEQDSAAVLASGAEAPVAASAPKEARAKASAVKDRALAAVGPERMDSALAEARKPIRQAKAEEAAAPVVAAAEPLPSPPPPPPPPAPAALAARVAGMAMTDAVAPAAPPVAAGARPEPQAKRGAAVAALSVETPSPTGHYRAESGIGLELLADGRFVLSTPAGEGATTTLGGRRVQESRGERLLPDAEGALPCPLWLNPEPGSGETLRLQADCESRHAGRYRREPFRP